MHECGEEVGIVFYQELDDSSNEDGHANANDGTRSKDLTLTQSRKPKNYDRKMVEVDVSQVQTIYSICTEGLIIRSLAQDLGSNKSIFHGCSKMASYDNTGEAS